ncbi:hypothetical protein BaRGS_00030765, partial [Batillaria attramentaria]
KVRQSGTPGATEISPASVVIIVIVVVIVVAIIVAAFVCWRKGWCRSGVFARTQEVRVHVEFRRMTHCYRIYCIKPWQVSSN